eukprot:895154-Pelagomonas_calceolata.AAC.1
MGAVECASAPPPEPCPLPAAAALMPVPVATLLGVPGCEEGVEPGPALLWTEAGWVLVVLVVEVDAERRMWAVVKAIMADSADTAWGARGPCNRKRTDACICVF